MGMTTPRLILYFFSMVVAVALIFVGCIRIAFWQIDTGLLMAGLGLVLVLLNSSRVDQR